MNLTRNVSMTSDRIFPLLFLQLQQLLTDLPHDMLDDSLSSSPEPNYSDSSGREASEHSPHWDHDRSWDSRPGIPNRQIPQYSNGYSTNQYGTDYGGKNEHGRNLAAGETMSNGCHAVHRDDERDTLYVNYNYPKVHSNDQSNVEDFHNDIQYDAPDPCSNSDLYHLPEDFQPYTNGHHQGEGFQASDKEHFQRFVTSEGTHSQPSESVQVKYHPYPLNAPQKDLKTQDPARSEDHYDDLQREFLETGESSASNLQFVQLQILYKARGRQLHELSEKLEESQQQMRYLNHQLVMVKDGKDGLAISLKESQVLLQNARETEVQLKGQMTALEKTIEGLTSKDEQLRKELKIAKVAMESMQQQVLDMCRSDSIQRAREQHEAVVSMLTLKHDEQVFMLQQKLDSVNTALQQQKDECCRLENKVTQAERKLEECKVEKTEIINRLTKSLEESQNQCANLLQTGSIQEATQLRLQLQQIQSSKNITDGMNKALQDEIGELKEQITMYESSASLGVFTSGSEQEDLSDSYVDLGIKKVNWRKSQFQRTIHRNGMRKDLSPDDLLNELKRELERCLNGNRVKRQQIIQLQSDLKVCRSKTEEMKMSLEKAEKNARDCEIRSGSLERQLGPEFLYGQSSNEALKEEIRKLQSERQLLQQEIEKHLLCIKELKENEEKMKVANQELCNEMRGMIQDFDRDKKEAIERCERTYEQHHEDIRKHLQTELFENFALEKEHLCQHYEEKISRLQSQVDEITNEMTAVQECYITVCKEKHTLEQTVQENVQAQLQINEGKIKAKLQKEYENALQTLKTELENKYEITLSRVKAEWENEKQLGIKQQIEAFVKLSKSDWIKEQQQVTENIIRNVENEWKHKLEEALEHAKSKTVPNLAELSVQTDQTLVLDLENKLQDALKDKERAVHEVRRELALQYHEDISKQVESALIKARARWLQELTSLPEYKTNLKLEHENLEQLHELNVKQQITEAVAAAEVNWRTKGDQADCTIRQKEFQKTASIQRELEQKNEECQALLKAELAKARAQWNKEKQEEIQQLQAQNEDDYRAFLDAQRTKISDVMSMAKGDFEKQKAELAAQKEADIKEQLNQNLKQWASEATQRLRDHENKILSETELILAEIHDEMVDKRIKDRLNVSRSLHLPVFDQLRTCLQRAIKGIVYKVLSTAKHEWDQKPDSGRAYHPSFPSSTPNGDVHETAEKSHVEELTGGGVQTGARNENLKRKDDGHECSRCAWCLLRIEKLKKECHELRVKLDKACRHLQQAVKEQKLKAEQIKEHETHAESIRRENKALLKKLEEIKTLKTQPSVPVQGDGSGCALCRGNALEEMRAQYIKAVDKIKNDMLRYIHDSKGRAAEMLKSEVLRERQETARKMRKYYLTCLQQLLKDDGKNEGAEKKIMNAASKLATMAKVLETPISQKCQNKTIRTAVTLGNCVSPDTAQAEIDSQKPPCTWATHRPEDRPTEQNTMEELIKRHKREKAEGSNARNNKEAVPPRTDQSSKHFRKDYPDLDIAHSCNLYSVGSKFSAMTALENTGFTCLDAKAQAEYVAFPSQGEPSFLQCLKTYRGCTDLQTKPDKQRFDIQETPVRDENASNDWSFVTDKGQIPSQSVQCSSKSFKLQQTSIHPESFSAPGLFCLSQGIQDPSGSGSEGQHYSSSTVKRRDQDASTQPSNKNIGLHLTAVKNSADSKRSADPSRVNNLPSRKLLQNYVSPRQDSGIDSPFSDFHALK
uniref:Centrosomal protein 152 n=1 Tax=Leptobrachium leishanense TaxID=445787 RepID=A0A8C5Q5I4_9ANUR